MNIIEAKALIIAPHFNTFIRGSIEAYSSRIESASIVMHHNPFSEISNIIPTNGYLSHVRRFTKKNLMQYQDLPPNARAYIISFPYIIPDASNTHLPSTIAKRVNDLIREEKIEFNIIHSHFAYPQGCAGAILKKQHLVPLVITAHGHDIYHLPFRNLYWANRIKKCLDSADKIIVVSENNVKFIKQLHIKTPIEVIPNGFRQDLFYYMGSKQEIKKMLGLPCNGRVILSVGNIEEIKGHEYLVDAMGHILKKYPDVVAVIVGSGRMQKKLHRKVRESGLENNVIFAGNRPHKEIPLWLNACDIFVLPSLMEGNPTIMFECIGCGTPFVGTRVGGIPEIINSDDYGLLCEPGDSLGLSESIVQALEKKWDNQRIVSHSLQFSWGAISKRIADVYDDVLS